MPLYSSFGADPFMADLVEMYVAEMPQRVSSLADAFCRNDRDDLQRFAHQIKGAAGGYGFDLLTTLAAVLEQTLRDDRRDDDVRHAVEDLIAACDQVRPGAPC